MDTLRSLKNTGLPCVGPPFVEIIFKPWECICCEAAISPRRRSEFSVSCDYRYWPNEDAIGKRFKGQDPRGKGDDWLIVVGIVRDMRRSGLERRPIPHVYEPYAQAIDGYRTPDLVVPVIGAPGATRAITPSSCSRGRSQCDPFIGDNDGTATLGATLTPSFSPARDPSRLVRIVASQHAFLFFRRNTG
jgi:hypothetical protein